MQRPTIRCYPPANDNATILDRPVVRAPRGRADAKYACSANVILPLRFAVRMPGWRAGFGTANKT